MSRKIVKFCFTTIGLAILVMCIVEEVDGVGRAAMIFSGIISTYIGFFIKDKKRD